MSQAGVTLENVRQIVREEIVAERAHTEGLVVRVVQEQIRQAIDPVSQSIESLRKMLEEDARAESARLTKVDKRSLKTQRLLAKHIARHAPDSD